MLSVVQMLFQERNFARAFIVHSIIARSLEEESGLKSEKHDCSVTEGVCCMYVLSVEHTPLAIDSGTRPKRKRIRDVEETKTVCQELFRKRKRRMSEGHHRERTWSQKGRGGFGGRGGRKKLTRFYKGGSEADPLNLDNVGIDPEQQKREEEEEANQIQGHMPKNPRDPLGLNKIIKRQQQRGENETPNKKQKHEEKTSTSDETKEETAEEAAARKKKEQKEYNNRKYHYGNFAAYYGTRLQGGEKDGRLEKMPKEWFFKKNVLDIGCNSGFLTLSIAKEYEPRRILGIDIDEHLVGVARKNIRHYCDADTEFSGKFPASFARNFGPISQTSMTFSTKFPDNVWFRKENYVLDGDFMLEMVEPEFHVVMALSITKWVHLNWGDAGMKRFFLRAFNHLLPGGMFILEPQTFETYKKRAKMLPELWTIYKDIQFKPDDFKAFLLNEVGFERVEELGAAESKQKGFTRPMEVYHKAGGVLNKPTKSEKKVDETAE